LASSGQQVRGDVRSAATGTLGLGASGARTPDEGVATDGIGRNTVYALLVQLTTGFFTTVVTLYLVRALGTKGLGLFALALGVGRLATLVADLGIPQSLARFLAEARGDRRAVAALLGDAVRLKLVTAAVVAATLFAAAGPIADAYGQQGLAWPVRGIALSLFAESLLALYVSAFIALGRNSVNLTLTFLESLTEMLAIVALVALGAGATGAAFGRAGGYAFGALVGTWMVMRLLGRTAVIARPQGRMRQLARYAVPTFLTNGMYVVYTQVDVLIIGALLGASAVGIWAAPMRLTIPLAYLGQAIANSVAPRQAASAEGANVRAFETSLRWLIIAQSALLAPIIVWAGPITDLLLGGQFHESANVLRALAVFIFLGGLSPLISITVNYLGQARQRIPIVISALLVNVVIDLTLLPRIGVVAAAIGTTVAYCLYVPAHFVICRRELGVPLRPLGLTLTRTVAAAAAMAGVLLLVGPSASSTGRLLIGAILATFTYAAMLLLTREISLNEIRRGRQLISMRLSRLRAPTAAL
jgi:O-antigen/teichoic acid export membrane protein